jgi:DNA-binding beta-propeller fold protein YncE
MIKFVFLIFIIIIINFSNLYSSTAVPTATPTFISNGLYIDLISSVASEGIAVDQNSNLYVSDYINHVVYYIYELDSNALNFPNTTVVGVFSMAGYSGDGSSARSANLNYPGAVALDQTNNILYIADKLNYRIRKLDIASGIISTIVGNGISGYSGDKGNSTLAQISEPSAIAIDKFSNIYFTDRKHNVLRKIMYNTNLITTLIGGGSNKDGKYFQINIQFLYY